MNIQNTGQVRFSAGAATGALQKTNKQLQKILERLSTAVRINRASDDAAGLAVAEQLQTQVRGFKMATQNIDSAISALNISEGTGGETSQILQRQRELALQARNDTLTDENRAAIDTEFQALNSELTRIAQSAQFNNQGTAAGEGLGSGNAQIQAGANAGETIALPRFNLTAKALGMEGMNVATSAGAQSALTTIDAALANLNAQRSTAGATVNALQSSANNLAVAMVNTMAAESVLRDQDMAEGMSSLIRERLLQEGATKAFARFNEMSQNHIMGLLQ